MSMPRILAVSFLCAAACGQGGSGAAPLTGAGTTDPSSASPAGGGLDIGANVGPGGALFVNDRPAFGEPAISGTLLVSLGGTQGAPPPPDTVVTLNGVQLAHAILGGAASPKYFTVDPAGPQPAVASDGFLHIAASSASAGISRKLNLACPFVIAATLTPAPGASLSGVSTVQLAWASGALPVQGRDFSAFGLEPPSASLHGFDVATHAMSFVNGPVLLAADSTGATLAVGATSASGYVVELRYPGVFFIDGETGGACGRTQRFIYAR